MSDAVQGDGAMRAADVRLTAILYLVTGLSMATIGVIVPFMGPIGAELGASGGQIGFAISLFSLPSALIALAGGAATDRIGVRRTLLMSGLIAVPGSLIVSQARSIAMIDVGLLVCGVAFAGISVSAPAALIASLSGGAQVRAMSFWSTYAPTGYALGLLMAVPFAGDASWRTAAMVHAAAMAVATALLLLVPALPRVHAAQGRGVASVLRLFADGAILRIGLAVALPNGISYGVSLVSPSYLARVHDIGLSLSSGAVAAAKIAAMVFGGLATGYLLSRKVPAKRLYLMLAATGLAAQVALFVPHGSFALAIAGLILWLFCFGGMAGTAMARLSTVVSDPARIGIASGAVGQMISIASFAAPTVYLGLVSWQPFCAIAAIGLAAAAVALPVRAGGARG